MRSAETIIVGGGPAGSAAAQRLKDAGADVLVLDKESFPRHKLCAGWITPEVVQDLQLDIDAYPHSFLSFRRLHWHLRGVRLPIPSLQHSIRRFEFDAWLLQRSGAEVVQHAVKDIRRDGEDYLIDAAFRCRYLIGAGGTSCPVHRALFHDDLPRARALQTVTLELEFPYPWRDADCHLWFFEHGLPGYSWYVPKARGWLNVGVGAMAARLKQRGENIRQHWQHLTAKLERRFGIQVPADPSGYSYYVRGPLDAVRIGNAFLTGDAAGLATRDLCEGIG
ncbi:MAG: NAD(P)/FAD-dependent oxidoreductase, partial [Steroidobacteraceae bacterium]